MVMSFEFLIHGKPNNFDSWGIKSYDSLEEKVFKEYFDQKEYLPECGHIVEIRSWKDVFYSIYTFVERVKDTSKRPSYCAVTLIFKGVYCRKSSDLFDLLNEVYDKKLVREANIIDSNHVFQINWYNDASSALRTIEKLTVDCINSQFQGLFEEIDGSFTKATSSFTSTTRINPKDCDSESFFDVLRKEGRIIVTESAPTKDALLSDQNELKRAYDEAKSIADSVPTLKETIRKSEDEISKLKVEKASLLSDNERLSQTIVGKDQLIKELKGRLTEKEKEIDFAIEKLRLPLEKIFSKIDGVRSDTKKNAKGWLKITPYIPLVNLFLLLLLCFLSFHSLANYDKKKESGNKTRITADNRRNSNQQEHLAKAQSTYQMNNDVPADNANSSRAQNVGESSSGVNGSLKECGLQVKDATGHILSEKSVIQKDSYLLLSVSNPVDGYSWHISNGSFTPEEAVKTSFTWRVNATESGDVIITYRPETEEARSNTPNKITLKVN